MMGRVTKMEFEWIEDDKPVVYSYHAHWNGLGGMLFKDGSTIATIDVADDDDRSDDDPKTLASKTSDWIVCNWDGAKPGKGKYLHPVIGRFHRSTVGDRDTLAQIALAMQTFTKLGWTRRRKSGTGQFEGEYA